MKSEDVFKRRLKPLASLAEQMGVALFAVGGSVRDGLLGSRVRDVDLLVEQDGRGLAAAAVKKFGGSFEAFDRFGTLRLTLGNGSRIDIARARTETYAKPAQLPRVRSSTLEHDLRRRDFTINAMARPLTSEGWGALIDPFGGAADLKARRLRFLHDQSFADDPTRIFRAARYAGRMNLKLEKETLSRLRAAVSCGIPLLLSRERIRQELMRILEEKDPNDAMKRLKMWNMLPVFHKNFRWPPAAAAAPDSGARLGLVALAMPDGAGEDFLSSLPLARDVRGPLVSAIKLAREKRSPCADMPAVVRQVLKFRFPNAPASAFEKRFINGDDLTRFGLPAGKEYALWLNRAARRQWRGVHRTRSEALAWLKKSLKK